MCSEIPVQKTFSRTFYSQSGSGPLRPRPHQQQQGATLHHAGATFSAKPNINGGADAGSKYYQYSVTRGSFQPTVNGNEDGPASKTNYLPSSEAPVCEHFLRNMCKYGDSCYKQHPANLNYGATFADVKLGVHQSEKPESVSSKSSKKSSTICTFFVRGACKNGDECRFIHESPVRPSPPVIKQPILPPVQAQTVQPSVQVSVNSVRELPPVCEHYKRGTCKYGDSCFKQHIDVPLLKQVWIQLINQCVLTFVLTIKAYNVSGPCKC